jgi:hypothetical protein
VGEGNDEIEVFDVTNLQSPQKIVSLPIEEEKWVWSIKFVGDYLWAGTKNSGIIIFDIHDPANAKRVGFIKIKDDVRRMIVEKNIVYVSGGPGGLYIYDITNPVAPVKLSKFALGGYVYNIRKGGDFIFIANDKAKKVQIVKVSDPRKPIMAFEKQCKNKIYDVLKNNVYVYVTANMKTIFARYNNPPVIAEIGDKKIDENKVLRFKVNASDPDYDPVSLAAANLPEGAVFDSTDTFVWKPNFEQSGVYSDVEFIATEKTETALKTVSKISIFVNHVNRHPVLDSLPDYTVDENTLLTFKVPRGTDPDKEDAGKLVQFIESLPMGAVFDSLSLTFTWTPTFEQSGVYYPIAVVKDPSGLTARRKFKITVNHVDRPPVVEKVQKNFVVDENKLLTIQFKGSDPDKEDQQKLKWYIKNLPEGAKFDANKQLFTWTPGYEQSGKYENIGVFLKVNDFIDSTVFAITVNHVSRPPVLEEIAAKKINEMDTLAFTVTAKDPDIEDEGKLVYSISNLPQGAVFDEKTGAFSWVPGYEQSGEYTLHFKVTDSAGETNEKDLKITVKHVNRPPVLEDIAAKKVNENELLSFIVKGSDPDKEDAKKLKIKAKNLPKGAVFDNKSNEFKWTPTFEQSGEYTVDFTLTDGAGGEDKKSVKITVVHVNRPPALEQVAAKTVKENKELKFTVKGSDPDKEDKGKIKLSAVKLPEGAKFDAGTGVFTWTPTYEQAGKFTAVFEITDAAGAKAQTTVDITVNNVNRKPEWKAELAAQTIDEGKILTYQLPAANDPDKEDAEKIKYSASNMPKGAQFDAATHTFSWTPDYDQSGKYTVNFEVTDGEFKIRKKMNITVNHVNRKPEWNGLTDQSIDENKTLKYKLPKADDPDKEDAKKLKYSASGLPDGAVFNSGSRTLTWKPTYDQAGQYKIKFSVTDGEFNVEKEISVTVNNTNRKPKISRISSQSLEEGESLSVSASASDPDDDNLSYSLDGNPSGMSIGSDGTITWNNAAPGSYNVTVTVSDGKGGEDSTSFKVNVKAKPKPEAPAQENSEPGK